LGALLGGLLGTAYGLRAPFFVGAVAYAVMLFVTWTITSNSSIEAAKATAPSG
jgi:predicted MFS family arabinose efflux permease